MKNAPLRIILLRCSNGWRIMASTDLNPGYGVDWQSEFVAETIDSLLDTVRELASIEYE